MENQVKQQKNMVDNNSLTFSYAKHQAHPQTLLALVDLYDHVTLMLLKRHILITRDVAVLSINQ